MTGVVRGEGEASRLGFPAVLASPGLNCRMGRFHLCASLRDLGSKAVYEGFGMEPPRAPS